MNRHLRKAAILGALIGLLALSTSPAAAMEVDNDTGQDAIVWFSCGVGCGNYFHLSTGESAARKDTDGTVELEVDQDDVNYYCENRRADQDPARVAEKGTIRANLKIIEGAIAGVNWKASQGDGEYDEWDWWLLGGQGGPGANGTRCWLGSP